jgi:uracil-DNA glycosylase family 4
MFEINEFDLLCEEVQKCDKCARMCGSQRVLNRSAGALNSDIMFIGEAPGRLGADSSGIPFHGDKAGHNFEELLNFARLDRSKLFVTNSVLCNPRDENGNNSAPSRMEIQNCVDHLNEQIRIINPKIVVTLGSVALEATKHISPHTYTLKESVRSANRWFNRILIPLYHPGQRAMLHRSMANQRSDYQFVSDQLRNVNKNVTPKKQYGQTSESVTSVVEYILKMRGSVSYFAIHKFFYLIEYRNFLKTGNRLTNAYFVRQKDGPYCTDLHIQKLKKSIPKLIIKTHKNGSIIISKDNITLFTIPTFDDDVINSETASLIDEVLEKYGNQNMSKLKHSVYLTRPMRNILFVEKAEGLNLYNSPIDFNINPLHLMISQ